MVNDWGGGFQGEIDLTNDQAAISSWSLEFDFGRNITQIWNATIESHSGTHYVVRNASWNGSLAPGATVTFGFLGTAGNVTSGPTGYVFNGVPLGGASDLPSISVADTTVTEGDSGSVSAAFAVTLSAAASGPVSVHYATSNGTALSGSDYAATSGVLTFAAGETSKTIPVSVLGDLLDEAAEDFTLTLSDPVSATLADGSARA